MSLTVTPVDRAELVELTRTLVSAGQPWCENSLDGPARPPEETRIAEPVAALLTEWGFDVRLVGRQTPHPTERAGHQGIRSRSNTDAQRPPRHLPFRPAQPLDRLRR
ncbi:hypothetical protein [Mycolicibacterium novocastrense]|uniref:hypothetical protein n=1 Tax=Mycolicibacterium novocastrense TaxID=59813 RepID=UPI000ACBF4D5|nr:hypothetical protein [Mycolicibacterium novocastrense]